MKRKNLLEQHIRGWFPSEPRLICSVNLQVHEVKQPPRIIPSEYTLGATKFAAASAVLWISLYGFLFFTTLHIGFTLSVLEVAAWAIAGAAGGALLGWVSTKMIFGPLLREYQYQLNGRNLSLLILLIVLLIASVGLIGWLLYSVGAQLSALLVLLYPMGVAMVITRAILLAVFERKHNMRIVQSWWETGLYLIPKPPQDNISSSSAWRR